MTAPLACWRCEQPGHAWAECQRPPAKTKKELDARIDDIVTRWDTGYGFKTWIKTRLIEIERNAYRKEKARAA